MEQLLAYIKMVPNEYISIPVRQCAALFLLVLLSLSFVLESQIVVGGEASELNEGSEKEEDIKEKKLFFISQLSVRSLEDFDLINVSNVEENSSGSSLFPEVLTPPPEQL